MVSSRETEHQRLARNVNELLQELRVVQAGVQFLFGFLLAVAFTEPYIRATPFQHVVHLIAVVFATSAVALLSAPAAWHRVLFRQGERAMIVEVANRFAIGGMACLSVAMTATVIMPRRIVYSTIAAPFSSSRNCFTSFVIFYPCLPH